MHNPGNPRQKIPGQILTKAFYENKIIPSSTKYIEKQYIIVIYVNICREPVITIEIRKELKSGVIELAILALLVRREMYGYELSQKILDLSSGQIEVKEGTLYPILYRLEERGIITSRWQAPLGRGKPRKYYFVTGKGRQYFAGYRKEWNVVVEFMCKILE